MKNIYIIGLVLLLSIGFANAYTFVETGDSYGFANNYLYVNYSTNGGDGLLWQVNHGGLSTYNISIPASHECWDSTTFQGRFFSAYTFSNATSAPQCYNSTSWIDIGTYVSINPGSAGASTTDNPSTSTMDISFIVDNGTTTTSVTATRASATTGIDTFTITFPNEPQGLGKIGGSDINTLGVILALCLVIFGYERYDKKIKSKRERKKKSVFKGEA